MIMAESQATSSTGLSTQNDGDKKLTGTFYLNWAQNSTQPVLHDTHTLSFVHKVFG